MRVMENRWRQRPERVPCVVQYSKKLTCCPILSSDPMQNICVHQSNVCHPFVCNFMPTFLSIEQNFPYPLPVPNIFHMIKTVGSALNNFAI